MKKILFLLLLSFIFESNVVACEPIVWKLKTDKIFGFVIDENKTPIPNLTIQVLQNSMNEIGFISETKTDSQGRFEITEIPSGKYVLRTSDKTYHFAFTYASLKYKKSDSKPKKEIVMTVVPLSKCSGFAKVRKTPN